MTEQREPRVSADPNRPQRDRAAQDPFRRDVTRAVWWRGKTIPLSDAAIRAQLSVGTDEATPAPQARRSSDGSWWPPDGP